jgi:hypothetical protein
VGATDQKNAMNPFPHDHPIPRRTLLRGAGLGAGLALTGSHGASTAGEMMEPTSAADTPVWSGEYWAIKADVKLNLWRKRAIATAGRLGAAGSLSGARLLQFRAD